MNQAPFESAPPEHQAALHNAIFGAVAPAPGPLNPPKPTVAADPIRMRVQPHEIRSEIPHSLVGKSALQSIGSKK